MRRWIGRVGAGWGGAGWRGRCEATDVNFLRHLERRICSQEGERGRHQIINSSSGAGDPTLVGIPAARPLCLHTTRMEAHTRRKLCPSTQSAFFPELINRGCLVDIVRPDKGRKGGRTGRLQASRIEGSFRPSRAPAVHDGPSPLNVLWFRP